MKQQTIDFEPWPPLDLALPDTIEEIERGRIKQRSLFTEQRDQSKAGRIARLLATVPGVTPADTLPPGGGRFFLAPPTG